MAGVQTYEVLQERESLFKLLAQTTPMQLDSKYDKYTIDPNTRYFLLILWNVSYEEWGYFELHQMFPAPAHIRQFHEKPFIPIC